MSLYQSGELQFVIRSSSRRKTLGITVDRDSSLILHIPENAQQSVVDRFVVEKRLWVYKKLAEKALWIENAYPPRQFTNGEGFSYLGRIYRLKTKDRLLTPLIFQNSRFLLAESSAYRARELFVDWYKQKASEYLPGLVNEYAQRIDKEISTLRILDLSNRWASCSEEGILNFHWKIMQLPHRHIRYIVAHEIAHLTEKHHNPDFWRALERVMPDYMHHLGSLRRDGVKYLRVN